MGGIAGLGQKRFFGARRASATEISDLFINEIYPANAIQQMRNDGYNPIIITSTHELRLLDEEKKVFLGARKKLQRGRLKVAHEILPAIQLQYIKDFLADEAKYNRQRTIQGKNHDSLRVQAMRSYRGKLARNHAEALATWLLDNDFDVTPLEHDDALEWGKETNKDRALHERVASQFSCGEVEKVLRFYKDARRDIHNLQKTNSERPDILSLGCAHAVVYDHLLGRDGSNSVYIPAWTRDFLSMWIDPIGSAQKLYLEGVAK